MSRTSDPYPEPGPERIRSALDAMHARRARLRRYRIVAVSSGLVVVAVVAILAIHVSSPGSSQLRVEGRHSTTTRAPTTTGPTTTASASTTSTAPTSTTTPRTAQRGSREIVYQPFNASGAIDPGLHVTANVTGTCISGESERSYRCFDASGAGGIYDPCFIGPHGLADPLVCPRDPVSADVVAFSATSAAAHPSATPNRPWAMQLSGGQVCLFVSAAWGGLGPYNCQRNIASVTPADCRQPQPAQPWWTTECQDEKTDASPFRADTVTTLWF